MEAEDRRFVFAVARRIVKDDATAHDVTQDALLLAFTHAHQFRGDSAYRTWLYRIATTAALSTLRRERNWRRKLEAACVASQTGAIPGAATPPRTPDVALQHAATVAKLDEEVATLDEKYRRVLEMRVHEGKTDEEVARALGISRETVKIRAFRARNMLRERLLAS